MPITPYLDNTKFDPEATRVMGVAFEMVRVALGLADGGDLANQIVAKRIIELAKAGELNPDPLCERAQKKFESSKPRPRVFGSPRTLPASRLGPSSPKADHVHPRHCTTSLAS
jgi:hypothetical protein